MKPNWRISLLAVVAVVALGSIAMHLPNDSAEINVQAHAARNEAALIHTPECQRIYAATADALERHVVEDAAAERASNQARESLVQAGVGPGDPRVLALYSREDVSNVSRENRQQNELEALKARARAVGCLR